MRSIWWRYIVLRGPGISAEYDGKWYDIEGMPKVDYVLDHMSKTLELGTRQFVATNMWEQREDGEVAVVYMWGGR
jgi:hypothetical protein